MIHITLVCSTHLSSDSCLRCGSGDIAEAQDVFMARQKQAEAAVMAALRGQHCITHTVLRTLNHAHCITHTASRTHCHFETVSL